jgi:SAM-dependent methyltransferase
VKSATAATVSEPAGSQALPSFPPPAGFVQSPAWTGHGFRVGSVTVPVLSYSPGSSGWTDELTDFHEENTDGTHFIDVASRLHTLRSLARWTAPSATIMDIGCSSGYMLRDLRERFPQATVLGADYIRGPLEKLAVAMPGIPLLQFNLVECPLPDRCLDAVVLLNVLEHIQDDAAAARQVCRLLRPGGIAVIEVPAGPHLFDIYDRQLLHFRRYDLRGLEQMLRGAGLDILESSHLGVLLYPFFSAVKRRNRRFLSAPPEEQRRRVSSNIVQSGRSPLAGFVMGMEARLRPWIPYPCGIRCLVTARRG